MIIITIDSKHPFNFVLSKFVCEAKKKQHCKMNQVKELNKFCADSMIGFLGINFFDINPTSIKATMPVSNKTSQPNGFLHGVASLVLAESLAGAGSYLLIDRDKYNAFGLQVSGNHISTCKSGILYADAQLIHKGNTTHVWEVRITDEEEKLISVVRVTNMVTKRMKKGN